MKIGDKEITIKSIWTRGDQRAYNLLIYSDSKIGNDGKFEISMISLDRANDFLIKTLTGLNDEEVSAMNNIEYQDLLDKCGKVKDGSGSK